jgi:hypothetical protein
MRIVKPIVFKNYGLSRESEGTYYDENGILQTAEVDELRLTYNPSTLEFIGPLIESAATNVILSSNNFNDSDWTKSGSPTLTPAATVSPDGTSNATLYAASGSANLYQAVSAPGNYIFSVYAKKGTASGSGFSTIRLTINTTSSVFSIDPDTPAAFEDWASIQALPDGWFRLAIRASVTGGFFEITRVAGNHYLFGAQAEISPFIDPNPTSYIATTDEVGVRAADIQSAPPTLVTSSIDENDHDDWDDLETYTEGEQVIVRGNYHRVYEATALGGNTDKFPPDNPTYWIDQGATNRWRMFDMNVGSEKQSVSDDSNNAINVLLSVDQPINSVILLNMDCSNVRVIMRDAEGNEVYNHYQELLGSSYESNWWSFFFGARGRIATLVLTDLPPYRPSTIELILNGGDAPAKIGKMIVGYGEQIGCARYGTSVGIVDFSRKGRDDFGNNFVIERRYIDRADFDIQILTNRVDEVKALLAGVRATPVVYIGDQNFSSTVLYGFYKDFSIVISGPKRSDCSIQVEGI